MATTSIRMTTRARYRGLQVTLLGDTNAGLLAIAGCGTPQELAIAAIAVRRTRKGWRYRVGSEWASSLDEVAHAAVRAREMASQS